MYISRMRANVVKEDVERTIGKVLEEKGHKRIPLNEHNIYYVKRYSDRLGFYVRCRDDERVGGGGGITIQFFFTTIQLPNDKQIVSYPGIEIHVLTKYSDITDELLNAAGNKVIAIENDIGSMSGMILAEMESPYLFPERSQIVKEVLTIYDIVTPVYGKIHFR